MNPIIIGPISTGGSLAPRQPASVLEQAERCLVGDARLRTYSVSCSFQQGILTIFGCVPTYYVKQLTQEVLRAIDGVDCLTNELEVQVAVRSAPGRYDC